MLDFKRNDFLELVIFSLVPFFGVLFFQFRTIEIFIVYGFEASLSILLAAVAYLVVEKRKKIFAFSFLLFVSLLVIYVFAIVISEAHGDYSACRDFLSCDAEFNAFFAQNSRVFLLLAFVSIFRLILACRDGEFDADQNYRLHFLYLFLIFHITLLAVTVFAGMNLPSILVVILFKFILDFLFFVQYREKVTQLIDKLLVML